MHGPRRLLYIVKSIRLSFFYWVDKNFQIFAKHVCYYFVVQYMRLINRNPIKSIPRFSSARLHGPGFAWILSTATRGHRGLKPGFDGFRHSIVAWKQWKSRHADRGVADGQVGPVLTWPLFGQTEIFFSCQSIFHPWSPCRPASISAI